VKLEAGSGVAAAQGYWRAHEAALAPQSRSAADMAA
jgi:hypothetical protein